MTLQEFAKATPDFWKWVAEGRKFKLWDDYNSGCVISKIESIDFYDTGLPFRSESGIWYKNAEPIKTIKKPVPFPEAVAWFEDPANGWKYDEAEKKGTYRKGIGVFSIWYIRKICEGCEPLPSWFPCVEVEQEAEG